MSIQRLRDAGFAVRLKPGGVIGVTPIEQLNDEQVAWIKSNKPVLVAELRREAANENAVNHTGADLRQCSECQHELSDADTAAIPAATPATQTTKATKKRQKKGEADRTVATGEKPTKSAATTQPELRHCVACLHDKRSPVNLAGGLTWCNVRGDVPPMLPGTRQIQCTQFEAANGD